MTEYPSGVLALQGLVDNHAALATIRGHQERLESMQAELVRQRDGVQFRIKEALRAVEDFAREQPDTFGLAVSACMSDAIDESHATLSQIERDVRAIVDGM